MGNEHEKKPGAATNLAATNLATFEPGKSTLAQQQPGINNRYIEGKEHCATPGASGCSLDSEVRARLVAAYQRKVRTAEGFYVQALGEIGLERMIQKDEELPAIITMAIDLLGGYVGGVVAKSLIKLRDSTPRDFLKTVDSMIDFQSTGDDATTPNVVKSLLLSTSPKSVETLMKTATDFGKKGLKAGIENVLETDEKADTLNYVDELKRSAAISFEHLDLDVPGNATDGQMIAAFHAFDAEMGNDVPTFKATLLEKIARYQSTVAKIGRADLQPQVANGQPQKREAQQDPRATTRDTQVTWVTLVGDPVPRLYYAKVDYSWHPNSAQPALDDKFVLTRPVELEFVNSAVLRHQQKWNAPPSTRMMTREDLAKETGDVSLLAAPRLDLSPVAKARSATPAPAPPVVPQQPPAAAAKPSVADAAVDIPPLLGVTL